MPRWWESLLLNLLSHFKRFCSKDSLLLWISFCSEFAKLRCCSEISMPSIALLEIRLHAEMWIIKRLLFQIVYDLVHRQWQMDSITTWHLITEQCVGFRFSFSALSNASFSISDITCAIYTVSRVGSI